ncbi:hypothetical protein N0V90_002319 [Kalmusia sp. IMI 367209]|nr:hypothetical protein N0V90_002319 [Kalmusia sp. IMI 367209]
MLEDIGDLPYAFLAPILRHIQVAEQLVELEANCPQIQGETGELWLKLIKRDVPGWESKPHQPRDPKNWSKVYKKLKRDAEKDEEAQQETLRQKMQALQKDRKGHQTTILEGKISLPSQRRSGWGGSSWGNPAAPAKTGKMAFDKLRRGMFDAKRARPKASMMPQHVLNERKKTVAQAPARLVRMQETEAPKRMLISKGASASIAGSSNSRGPVIKQRPIPQLSDAAPERAGRSRLPTDQQFSAPKPPRLNSGQPLKRSRTEHSVLVEPKRRKV